MVLPTTRTVMGMTRALRALVMTITVHVVGKTHFLVFHLPRKETFARGYTLKENLRLQPGFFRKMQFTVEKEFMMKPRER